MRVLIDLTQINREKAGVGVYALHLISEIMKTTAASSSGWMADTAGESGHRLEVFALIQDDDKDFKLAGEGFRLIPVRAKLFRRLPLRFVLEQIYIPWLARKLRIDVIHSLHYSFPLLRTRAKKIVTVHDLTSFLMPEVHTAVKRRYFHFFIRAASKDADGLIFVSQSTQSDWRRFFPQSVPTEYVIPLGKGDEYAPDLSETSVLETAEKYGLRRPYVLYIGTLEPRKNLARLAKAFSEVRKKFPGYVLVIAGKKGWMYEDLFRAVSSLNLADCVIFTGFVSEEDKPYLIAGADAFVYPSLYEGFGIPVLEALSCGIPTLTSNNSSLKEVAGNAAILVDPTDLEELACGLESLLGDSELRCHLRREAPKQAAKFSWVRMSQETLTAYYTVAGHLRADGGQLRKLNG